MRVKLTLEGGSARRVSKTQATDVFTHGGGNALENRDHPNWLKMNVTESGGGDIGNCLTDDDDSMSEIDAVEEMTYVRDGERCDLLFLSAFSPICVRF